MSKRIKVLYLITKSGWGGAQRYVYDLATRLPRERFDISVAAGGNGPLLARLRGTGVRVIPVASLDRDVAIRDEIRALAEIVRILLAERPDVIHLSSSKAGGLGAIAAFLYKLFTLNFKLLTIYTVHGWPFGEPRPRWQRMMIFSLTWLSTMLHNRVIVISAADLHAARWFVPDVKLRMIPLGIDAPVLLPRAEAQRELARYAAAPLDADTTLIGTVAELTRNKGLPFLVEAARHLHTSEPRRHWRIMIIGEGEDRALLASLIRSAGLSERISLLGFIPDATRLLPGFDVFVLPSLKEGLPYALMEAMASGLPVVASAVGGVPDLVTSSENGLLVPPGEGRALAGAITALLLAPERRALLGRAAAHTVTERFTFRAMLAYTLAAYRHAEDH